MTALPVVCTSKLVGLLRLLKLPAAREEALHVHVPVRHELGALGLPLLREGPGADHRHLPAQEIPGSGRASPGRVRRRSRPYPTSAPRVPPPRGTTRLYKKLLENTPQNASKFRPFGATKALSKKNSF